MVVGDHEGDEVDKALANAERTFNAHSVAVKRLKQAIERKRQSTGKGPTIAEDKGRPAVK